MRRRATRTETLWLSLYRETDAVVARAMAADGLLHVIEPEHCPPSHAVNEHGAALLCAAVVPAVHRAAFEERCKLLRA